MGTKIWKYEPRRMELEPQRALQLDKRTQARIARCSCKRATEVSEMKPKEQTDDAAQDMLWILGVWEPEIETKINL